VNARDVADAARRLNGIVRRTPVLASPNTPAGEVNFKCENLQHTGSFKFRGAYHALTLLDADTRRHGVLAYSSGNHAQGIALAGRMLETPVVLVMPKDAPAVKLDGARSLGAEVVLYDPARQTREALALNLAEARGLALIPPFDHPHIIAGQGSAAWELFDQTGALDWLLVPCGGGGLLSGSALAALRKSPRCRLVGVEPELAADGCQSFKSGQLLNQQAGPTIADGLRTPSLGLHTFEIIQSHVHDMVSVSDPAIAAAMRWAVHNLKLVLEPSGAVALAALLAGVVQPRGKIGIILSGGNVDPSLLGQVLQNPPGR
jgi:threonine dehydratase